MKHIKKMKIDIDKKNFEVIPSVQYDSNTRFLHIHLLNGSVPLNLSGCSVKISGTKQDGTAIFNNCTVISEKEGFVEVELTEQMNAAPGTLKCELKLYNGKGVLTTKHFDIDVTASVTSKNITSSNEFKALDEALSKVNNIDTKFATLTSETVARATTDEIGKLLAAGQLAHMTIANGSIGKEKLDPNIKFGVENGEVTSLKLSDDLKHYIGMRNFSDFQVGNINNSGALETTVYYNNIISRDIIDGHNIKIVVKKPSIIRVKITYYTDDGRFSKHDSWTSETITIQKNCNIRIGVCLYQQTNKYTVNEMLDFIDIVDMNSLNENISILSTKVDKILGGNSSVDFGILETGSIAGDNGTNVSSTTRVRSVESVRISKEGRAYFLQEGKYMVAVCTYNLDTNSFISQTTWLKEYRIEETTGNIGYRFMIKRVDEANLTNLIPEVINDFRVVVRDENVLNIPEGSIGERELNDELKLKLNAGSSTNINVNNSTINNYIHISFDDVSTCITDITKNKDKYTSIFDNVFLNFIKQLHENYGAVFSLYLYNINNLSNFPDKFKDDFIKSNKWLKFGLHAKDSGTNYGNSTAQQGKEDWDFFITQMYRISGGYGSIDRIPRLHNFAGSKQCLTAMRDCDCGALGFLSADDSRNTYYLNSTQKEYLRTHDKLEDIENGLIFLSTDLRLDWFNSGFSLPNQYNKPVKNTPYEELVYRYSQPMMGDCYHSLIVLTHEWEIYGGSELNSKKSRVEDVCKFGVDYGYSFDFPQNRTNGGITSLKLAFDAIKSLLVE